MSELESESLTKAYDAVRWVLAIIEDMDSLLFGAWPPSLGFGVDRQITREHQTRDEAKRLHNELIRGFPRETWWTTRLGRSVVLVSPVTGVLDLWTRICRGQESGQYRG